MGCCNNDKGCEKQQKARRVIPWFRIVLLGLIMLVVVHWQ